MSFKFERLDVWKRAADFANEMFDIVEQLPQKYQYSLGDQLKRAALSIPTNIAEGAGRDGIKESKYFYRIAKGSVYEVVSLLVMTKKRNVISDDSYKIFYQEANELAAMLTALAR